MKKVTILFAAILVFGVSSLVNAQDSDNANHAVKVTVPTVNLVDIEDEVGNNATTTDWAWTEDMFGDEAGGFELEPLVISQTFYLQYTSIKDKNTTNKITAELDANDIPAAMSLQVKVDENAKAGKKKGATGEGNAAFETIPAEGSIDIVTGIKTCFTGTDAGDGHKLNYQLVIDPNHDDFGEMEADVYDATITYTIIGE